MTTCALAFTEENEALSRELEQLNLEFVDLFTNHKHLAEQVSVILTSLYLEKLGHLQLELLQKQTETASLKMKMNLMQAAINRDEQPDMPAIERLLNERLRSYYKQIQEQAADIEQAKKVLSRLLPEEESLQLKELFRLLCKRLHPDLNPNQTEEEKDLFIRVKAAYDQQMTDELQKILLYLSQSGEKPSGLGVGEKRDRVAHLKKNIALLKDKIDQLKQSFPFNMEELINDEEAIRQQQEEIRQQIQRADEEIEKYTKIINIMANE